MLDQSILSKLHPTLDPLKSNNVDGKTKGSRYLGALLPQSGIKLHP